MAKIKGEINNDFCPQSLWLYGNYEDSGRPHFGLFSWFGWCWLGEEEGSLGVMACIGEEKISKDLIRKNGVFSANLVNEALLPLADYYGCTSGRDNPDKMNRQPAGIDPGLVLNVPTISESPVSLELRVVKEERMCRGRLAEGDAANESTLFLCKVENVLIDQRLADKNTDFAQRMALAAPVVSPGESKYMGLNGGKILGSWGEMHHG